MNQKSGSSRRRAGLIGAGNVGTAIATRLVEVGWDVSVANSRGPTTLLEFQRHTGAKAVNVDAIGSNIDVLILAVPFSSVSGLRHVVQRLSPGTIVVDSSNYVPSRDGAIAEITKGVPETAWIAGQLGVPVVKAFNNIVAGSLATAGTAAGAEGRVALPVCGDDLESRRLIMKLVEELGFTAYDGGPLDASWRQQPGQPAYCTNATASELPALLARADRAKGSARRDQVMKVALRIRGGFPADVLTRASRFAAGLDRGRPSAWLATARVGLEILRR
jgi:predicted dinucleotide-binding enzyme